MEALGLLEGWIDSLRRLRRSPQTILGYARDVRTALGWLAEDQGRPVAVADLSPEALRRYLAAQAQTKHANTENRYISALRSLFGYLVEQQHLPEVPTLARPRVPRRLPRTLTKDQAARLMGAPRALPLSVEGRPRRRGYREILRLRDAAALEVLYATGIRGSELARLDLSDVELKEHRVLLRIQGKGDKERTVPGYGPVVPALRAYLSRRHEQHPTTQALFVGGKGGRLGRNGLRTIVTKWARACGLRVYPHLLRHTCARHLIAGGMHLRYVQQLLGHSSAASTAIYTEVSAAELGPECAAHHPRVRLHLVEDRPEPAEGPPVRQVLDSARRHLGALLGDLGRAAARWWEGLSGTAPAPPDRERERTAQRAPPRPGWAARAVG